MKISHTGQRLRLAIRLRVAPLLLLQLRSLLPGESITDLFLIGDAAPVLPVKCESLVSASESDCYGASQSDCNGNPFDMLDLDTPQTRVEPHEPKEASQPSSESDCYGNDFDIFNLDSQQRMVEPHEPKETPHGSVEDLHTQLSGMGSQQLQEMQYKIHEILQHQGVPATAPLQQHSQPPQVPTPLQQRSQIVTPVSVFSDVGSDPQLGGYSSGSMAGLHGPKINASKFSALDHMKQDYDVPEPPKPFDDLLLAFHEKNLIAGLGR